MRFRTLLKMVVFCAVLLSVTTPRVFGDDTVDSVPYTWKSAKIGAGGFIPGIVFSPVEQGLVYLRSDMGGAYRWDDESRQWIPLQDHLGESNYLGIESVAPDPVDANVVYLAAGMYHREPAAMLRSRDRGTNWDIFPVEFKMGGNENGRSVGERLAVDPNKTNILYFASRFDSLLRSEDSAETWHAVENFPVKGQAPPEGFGGFGGGAAQTAGLSFIVFDPRSGVPGEPTPVIYVGSTEPGDAHLFRSIDAGQTWEAIPGQPAKELIPSHAALDSQGMLYISYGNNVGPNDVTNGAVWKWNAATGEWTDITPDKSPNRPPGGYGGIAIDRQRPGTVAVTTLDRWDPVDTVWRTTDGGQSWRDIAGRSERDVSETPYLFWGDNQPKLGWWMSALAIDPFDSNHACYSTGATIYATREFEKVNADEVTHWQTWITGIEQTAVISIMSPAAGPHLVSGLGDVSGFTHDDFEVSPPMHANPTFTNTNLLDYAARKPEVLVRAGTPHVRGGPTLGYSEDGGRTWQPLPDPPQPQDPNAPAAGERRRGGGLGFGRSGVGLTISADGAAIIVTPRVAMLTRNRGESWDEVAGLPARVRPVADRVNAKRFYALDQRTDKFYTSTDGGATFAAIETTGLPTPSDDAPRNRNASLPIQPAIDREGDLWLATSSGLFHSTDGGARFTKLENAPSITGLSFGKGRPGQDYPSLYAIGTLDELKAIWRSDDVGASWLRINDDAHQWGTRFRCIAGDPRIVGRVYLGTDGRGVFYGSPRSSQDVPPHLNGQ